MANSSLQPTPSTPAGAPQRAARRRKRSPWRIVLWTLLALIAIPLAVLLVLGVRVAIPGYAGYRAAQSLLDQSQGGMQSLDPAALTQSLGQADAALDAVAANLQPLHPLLRSLDFVPTWGGTLAAAPELLAVAQPLSDLVDEVAPLLDETLGEEELIARAASFATALAADPARMERVADHARAASAALEQVDTGTLHPQIGARLAVVAPLLARLPELLPAVGGLPTLLGMDEPHTLLLLVQNNHELRPTGGFLTAAGQVTLDRGQVTDLQFSDSYAIFRYGNDYPPAPPAMQRFMALPYLTFRDANWSPDLPTSAQIAGALYTQDTGLTYDSVVTVDLDAVALIIDALSPLQIEGVAEAVTGDNILAIMKELWARPADADVALEEDVGSWWRERKTFIPKLAQAALQKAMGGSEPLLLATAVLAALDARSLQLVVDEAAVAAVMAAEHWDGSLQPGAEGSDYLALVDTNMGFNKADAAVTRTLAYTLTLPSEAGGRALAEVSVTYTHPITTPDPGCDQTPRYGTRYDDMVARCYFVYPRLFVPGGSTLIDVTGVPSDTVSSQRGEQGTQVFSGFLTLPTNSSATVTWRYELAEDVLLTPDAYRLVVQRQAGTRPLPLTLAAGDRSETLVLEQGRLVWGAPE